MSGKVAVKPKLLAAQLCSDLADGFSDTAGQLETRAQAFGANRLPPPKTVTLWELVLEAFDVSGEWRHCL